MNILNIPRLLLNYLPKPSNGNKFSTAKDPPRTSIQVCLLGGHTSIGSMTAFLIKQNPIVSKLKIHGDEQVNTLVADLNQMDTKCVVEAYPNKKDASKALWGVDIVLLLQNQCWPENTPLVTRVLAESKRVYKIVKECTEQAPRALILCAVPPVSVFTPFVAEVFKMSNFYHPGRIIGSAATAQVRVNSLVGRYLDLNPLICQVPIIGGPDVDLAVPLFNQVKPVEINCRCASLLMAKFRRVNPDEFPKKHCRRDFIENNDLSGAFALNNMIMTLGLGIFEDPKAYCNAFVRMNLLPNCKYLVSSLQFSSAGVVHNFGIPSLTSLELDMLETAVLEINKREQIAKELVDYCEGKLESPPFEIEAKERAKALSSEVIK